MNARRARQRLPHYSVSGGIQRVRPPGAVVGRPEDRHDRRARGHGQVQHAALVAHEQSHLLQQRHQRAKAGGWTDDRGTAREQLFRVLTTPGNAFDIQFRVIDAVTSAVVLKSECYQFFVR